MNQAPHHPFPRLPPLLLGFAICLVVFSLHHWAGWSANRGDYTPFSVDPRLSALTYDETQLYIPGPMRFFRTGRVQAELDVFELRDVPNSYPVLHSLLLGLLARLAGSLENGWMAAHAIVPSLVWALLYWRACAFVRSSVLAMAIAWAVCFAPFGLRNYLLLGQDRFLQPLELTRMPQPALSFLFLLAALSLLSGALARPAWWRTLAAGIAGGALFYVYYFYWIAFFAGAGALLVVAALLARWSYLKTIAAIFAVAALAGAPYFVWTLAAMNSGHQRHLMSRVGDFTRRPDVFGLVLAGVLACLLWLYCRFRLRDGSDDRLVFAAVLLAAAAGAAIGLNFHLLTGFDAQHAHFHNRALQPLLGYLALLLLAPLVLSSPRLRPLAAGAAVVLLVLAAGRQFQVGKNTAARHRASNPDIDVLIWARAQLPPGAVIGAGDGNLLTLIPGIAGAWTFVPLGDRSMASTEEILRRYLLVSRLEGRNWPEVEAGLRSDLGYASNASSLSYILIMQRRISPDNLMLAKRLWNGLDLERDFRQRRLDYLIVPRRAEPSSSFSPADRFETLYRNPAWAVLRVAPHP